VSLSRDTILESSQDAEFARDYLFNIRKLSEDVVKKFEIGYVPQRARHKLSGRIIMPIKDMSGRNVALTTRLIAESEGARKHWHESFIKNRYLYGIFELRENILKRRKVVIVEGQFDALRLYGSGISVAIATLGSAISICQLSRIIHLVDDIFLCFDNDDAGKKATGQVYSLLKKYELWRQKDIRVMSVPLYGVKDPDEYISKFGKEDFINKMKESKKRYESRYRKDESRSIFDFEVI
jgi:DNA primase